MLKELNDRDHLFDTFGRRVLYIGKYSNSKSKIFGFFFTK